MSALINTQVQEDVSMDEDILRVRAIAFSNCHWGFVTLTSEITGG